MSILFKLTKKHLILNRKRTLLTIVGIMISMAMVTAITGFFVSFQDLMKRETIQNTGDWHVVFIDVNDEQIATLQKNKLFSSSKVGFFKDYEFEEGKEKPIIRLLPQVEMKMKELNRGIYDKTSALKKELNIPKVEYNRDLLMAEGIFSNDNYDNGLFQIVAILIGMIVIGSIIVISNSFYTSASERGREFGILKSIGATEKQIRKTVVLEGVILSGIAIPGGFLLGMLVETIALFLANYLIGKAGFDVAELKVKISALAIVLSIVVAYVTVMISTTFPAFHSSRIPAIDLIRQTRVFKLRKRDVKIPWYIKKFFGFEGVLAAKSLRRNRGKYRATIISLVVSIVLFVGGSSYVAVSNESMDAIYQENGTNVRVGLRGMTSEVYNQVIDELGKIKKSELYPISTHYFTVPMVGNNFSNKGKEVMESSLMTDADGLSVLDSYIISVSDTEFERICKENHIEISKLDQESNIRGILINSTGVIDHNEKKIKISPFSFETGNSIELISEKEEGKESITIQLGGVIDEVPKKMALSYSPYAVNVLVPNQTFVKLSNKTTVSSCNIFVNAQNADAFEKEARKILDTSAESLSENNYSIGYFITNFEKQAEEQRNFKMLIMLFVYGFVAMLTLIGVTSVISTISTTTALRKREFAILRSIGMSDKNMSRMFNLESLLYGMRAIIIGIPLALGLSYLTHSAQSNAIETPFEIPWISMLISIVAILLLTFATMHVAKTKQRKENTIDVLTQSNI